MTHPWNGNRHRSWGSNTILTLILLIACLAATVSIDVFANSEPPNYLIALLGTSAGAFFAAIGSDKQKKDTEVAHTAERAEAKVDALVEVAGPEAAERIGKLETDMKTEQDRNTVLENRAADSEERESGWSKHRDHTDDEGDDPR